jgi:O-methyltransferase involved in polyketide biosynthesis
VGFLCSKRFLGGVGRLVEEIGATQLLELAAGLSPRGMELAQRGVVVYVEADLAASMTLKRQVVTAILGSVPKSLFLCGASVIDRVQLLTRCFPFVTEQPVTVTAEGLLRYLTLEEKAHLSANVNEVLRRFGGWWITPDIHLRNWAQRQSPMYGQSTEATLGRNLDSNYFDDLDHAQRFFGRCGLAVNSRPLLEGIRDQMAAPLKRPIH